MVRKTNNNRHVLLQMESEFRRKMRLLGDLRRENVELHCKQEILSALYDILKELQQQTTLNPDFITATEQLLLEQLNSLPALPPSPPIDGESPSHSTANNSSSSSGNAPNSTAATPESYCNGCASIGNASSLRHSSGSGDSGAAVQATQTAAADEGMDVESAAPPGDPLCLFREALCHPQLADEGITVSMQEVQADAIKTVKELSYLLYQYERGTYKAAYAADDPARPQPLKQIRDELLRHFQLACLAAFGKSSESGFGLLFTTIPFDGPGKAVAPQEINLALYASTVKHLDLTVEQMDRIQLGFNAFKGILDAIHADMTTLQQQLADAIANQDSHQQQPVHSDVSHPGTAPQANAGNLMSAFSSLYKHLGNSSERQGQLQRLHVLLNKNFLLRCALLGYVYGCMTVPQCAKAFVGVSPFPLLVVPFCTAIAEHKEQLLKQQQQAQQAAAVPNSNPRVTVCGVCAAKLNIEKQ